MTLNELNELITNLKLNGMNDKQMQYTFLLMYANNKISYEELDNLSDEERKEMIKNMFKQYE